MEHTPDIEVYFHLKKPLTTNLNLSYLIDNSYLASGFHQYHNNNDAYGTITFTEPEAYPHCLWIGKTINIQNGNRLVGYATVNRILNPISH